MDTELFTETDVNTTWYSRHTKQLDKIVTSLRQRIGNENPIIVHSKQHAISYGTVYEINFSEGYMLQYYASTGVPARLRYVLIQPNADDLMGNLKTVINSI